MAEEFVTRLNNIQMPLDVFVTTTLSKNKISIENAFRNYKFGKKHIFQLQNRGRDIGPFITHVGDMIRANGYEVVGHFHSKKSVEIGCHGRSELAQLFSWEHCLANHGTYRKSLLLLLEMTAWASFSPRIAMWSAGRRTAPSPRDFAERLLPRPTIHEHPVFPNWNHVLGTCSGVKAVVGSEPDRRRLSAGTRPLRRLSLACH